MNDLKEFVRESNMIERIMREPTEKEVGALEHFINLKRVTVADLEKFVRINQPDAVLRDKYGLNVRVGNYYPPFGSPEIRYSLENLLISDYNAHRLHCKYEELHPFTDCNGRSGRALWAWKMQDLTGGFLLNFYFHTLQDHHKE